MEKIRSRDRVNLYTLKGWVLKRFDQIFDLNRRPNGQKGEIELTKNQTNRSEHA